MKNREEKKHIIIDEFYKEDFNRKIIRELGEEELNFKRDMEKMDEAMNLTEDMDLELDINLDKLIGESLEILDNKRDRREKIIFLFIAFIVLALLAAITIIGGLEFVLYFQIILSIVAPFILIPIAKNAVVRGDK